MTLNHSHEIGTYGKLAMPLVAMFFDGSNLFSYFGRRLFSDYFYQIILNSGHWFQRRFQSLCYRDKCPLAAMFLTDKIPFSYICRGSASDLFLPNYFQF